MGNPQKRAIQNYRARLGEASPALKCLVAMLIVTLSAPSRAGRLRGRREVGRGARLT
jgi:hypothetical protein